MAITTSAPDPKEIAQLKALMAAGGTGGGGGKVYMGSERIMTYGGQKTGEGTGAPRYGTKDNWASESDAISSFYGWSTKKQRDFLAQGIIGGQLKLGDGPMEAGKLWTKLVKEASMYGKVGRKVSPIDLLASYVGAAGGSGKSAWQSMGAFEVNTVTGEKRYAGPGQYLGGGVARQTDTRTDLTDPDTAKAMATKLFQDLMGRDPGAGELGAFGKALGAAEAASPITQTTDTTYSTDTGQQLSSNTTSSGGLAADAKQYIGEQQIKKKKEYGVNQAVTTYQNAFENLIYGAPE